MLTQEKTKSGMEKPLPPTKDFIFTYLPVDGYEQVVKIENAKTGLKAFIAIHDLTLGPALGGIRIYPYAKEEDALNDVLRLSKGMTYKAAISEVGTGGGKSVIIASPKEKTKELLHSFAEAVNSFKGNYICAEDLGCTLEDAKVMSEKTKYIVGLPSKGSSGNPSPFTAWGTFRGIQSVIKKITGSDSLEGIKVAIQGMGSVGSALAEYLFWAGAELFLADADEEKAKVLAAKYRANYVPQDQILFTECDVLAPCAMGGIINDETIHKLRCKAIAGCANNQLLRDEHAELLKLRDIIYAPDYVINGGGLLNVTAELKAEGYNPSYARAQTHKIYDTLLSIYDIAEKNQMTTVDAANALAEYRVQYGIGKRVDAPVYHHSIC